MKTETLKYIRKEMNTLIPVANALTDLLEEYFPVIGVLSMAIHNCAVDHSHCVNYNEEKEIVKIMNSLTLFQKIEEYEKDSYAARYLASQAQMIIDGNLSFEDFD